MTLSGFRGGKRLQQPMPLDMREYLESRFLKETNCPSAAQSRSLEPAMRFFIDDPALIQWLTTVVGLPRVYDRHKWKKASLDVVGL
jgi:hypothetical protein